MAAPGFVAPGSSRSGWQIGKDRNVYDDITYLTDDDIDHSQHCTNPDCYSFSHTLLFCGRSSNPQPDPITYDI